MKSPACFLSLIILALVTSSAPAQVDTSHHKGVYAEINARLDSMQVVTAHVTRDAGPIALTGWLEDGTVRKIVAKPGNSGNGFDEFYLEQEKPLFVFGTRTNSETGKRVEERLYFVDGAIAKWLTTEKSDIPHSEDYIGLAEQLNTNCAAFVLALKARSGASTATQSTRTFARAD